VLVARPFALSVALGRIQLRAPGEDAQHRIRIPDVKHQKHTF
jgi:hypothetical protein